MRGISTVGPFATVTAVVELKERVRGFWEGEPCGSTLTDLEPGSAEYYEDIERKRYRLEPFIPSFAEFQKWRGKRVLEVGVGLGTDFTNFARAGAELSGIDLTEAAVTNVRKRLELEGLEADVQRGDAESLPFEDATFDLVYSWGVLQHTPDTAGAVAEVRRVTKPGGQARIMLYGRHSWVALGLWARYELLAGRPFTSLGESVARHMQGPRVKSYTEDEIRELLSPHFRELEFRRYLTPYDKRVGGPVAAAVGDRAGWFIAVIAHA